MARSLFGDGPAKVIGLPPQFDLVAELKRAKRVCLLSAFAKQSGWDWMKPGLEDSKARFELVAGSNFWQTEPKVLWDWLSRSSSAPILPYLHNHAPMFHPKLLLVEGSYRSFAVIGSGNLTSGGLEKNVECGVYVTDRGPHRALFDEARLWVNEVLSSPECRPLTRERYKEYATGFKKNRHANKAMADSEEKARKPATKGLRGNVRYVIPDLSLCHEALRRMVKSKKYKDHKAVHGHEERQYLQDVVTRLGLLDSRMRGRIKADWNKLIYDGAAPLGPINPVHRRRTTASIPRLRKCLDLIGNQDMHPAVRLGMAIKTPGIGSNIASKLLLALDPKDCPVMNGGVIRIMKGHFQADFEGSSKKGDPMPRDAHNYAAFRKVMIELRRDLKLSDMIELDRAIWLLDN